MSQPAVSETATQHPDRVLVADDSRVNRSLLRGILKRQGLEVVEAEDGGAAVRTALEEPPELILLDIDMPVLDGFGVCQELKHHQATAEVPIIFLSSHDAAAEKIRGLEMGAADYVTKPFDRGEVLARVRTQLRVQHLNRSLREANRELRRHQQSLDDDLRAAADIQRSLLPGGEDLERMRCDWCFRPCSSIGGDIFNAIQLTDRETAIYIADVAGHGVPSALVSISVSHRLSQRWLVQGRNGHRGAALSPSKVLHRLDFDYPIERFDRFFTLAYLLVDTESGLVRYSCAGHPPPLVVRGDGSVERLEAGGPPIGLGEYLDFTEDSIQLEPGERIVLYTDGVVEAPDAAGRLLDIEGLEGFVRQMRRSSPSAMCAQLEETLVTRCGTISDHDDVSFMAVDWIPD